MNDLRTAAQQALEALQWISDCHVGDDDDAGECASCHERSYKPHAPDCKKNNAITALRAALTQQKDPTDPGNDVDVLREHVRHLERRVRQLHAQQAEPVAGVVLNEEGRAALVEHGREEWHCVSRNARRLYTAPPQRKPLTEEEIDALIHPVVMADLSDEMTDYEIARAVERAHGIKEN